ncbi:MAG: MaoC/PaaZ C-terminal domain-containing protein [Bdellovibrionota bacterium]
MNELRLSQIQVGLKAEFPAEIPMGAIERFADLSGDHNSLHCDPAFSREAGHRAPVAHGMLTAGLYSQLVGHHLPGKFALLHRVDAYFLKPVFEGDQLVVRGEVTAVNETVGQIEIKAEIERGGEKVGRARIWAGVRE